MGKALRELDRWHAGNVIDGLIHAMTCSRVHHPERKCDCAPVELYRQPAPITHDSE